MGGVETKTHTFLLVAGELLGDGDALLDCEPLTAHEVRMAVLAWIPKWPAERILMFYPLLLP